jgi:hypothetical protein
VGGEGKYQKIIWIIFNLLWFLASLLLVGQGFFFDDQFKCYDYTDEKQCKDYVCGLDSDKRAAAV